MRSLDVELPRHADSVRVARAALGGLELGPRADDCRLVVSELVTNAVHHGEGGSVFLRVRVHPDRVWGEVSDRGEGFKAPAVPAAPGAAAQLGLRIVDALAASWGVREGVSAVWFELPAP